MTPEERKEYFLKYIQEQFDKTLELRNEFNKDISSLQIKNIDQGREFYKNLTLLSGAVFTLILTLGKPVYPMYLFIGAGFYIVLIFLIILYMRELLDKENIQLRAQSDNYNDLLTEMVEFYGEYLKKDPKDITEDLVMGHFKKMQELRSFKDFTAENKKIIEDRKNRIAAGEHFINFAGEIFVSIFMIATFFSLVSLYGQLSVSMIFLVLILLIILSFGSTAVFTINFFSKPASIIFNNKYFKKLKNKKIF
jgi:protein-S-isoprenylcysteine O-methyltransferase Ste14